MNKGKLVLSIFGIKGLKKFHQGDVIIINDGIGVILSRELIMTTELSCLKLPPSYFYNNIEVIDNDIKLVPERLRNSGELLRKGAGR